MKTTKKITIKANTSTEDIARVLIAYDPDMAYQLAEEIKHQLTERYLKAIKQA